MKRVGQLLLIFSFIIFIAGREPFLASAASRTVKVGYYPILNFQEYDQVRHQYRGYGYEYLQAVASYAGWELELVPVSYQEAIQRLADGQLDLIFHAVRNQKLEETALDYYVNPYEASPVCLVVNDVRSYTAYGDYQAINALEVGLVREDSQRNEQFFRFCDQHNCTPKLRYYDTPAQVRSAMAEGKIDASLSCRYKVDIYRTIEEFGDVPINCAVTKGNRTLVRELAQAIGALHRDDASFDHTLYQKYYHFNGSSRLVLTQAEQNFIRDNPVVNVSYNKDWRPLCYQNKQGQIDGAMARIYEEIARLTGLKFNYVSSDSLVGAFAHFVSGRTQLMADLPYDYTWAAQKKARLTVPFMRIVVVAASKKGGADNNVVAIPEGFYQTYLGRDLRRNNFIYKDYKNMEACIKAVLNNEAQYVFFNSYQLEYYRNRADYRDLSFKIVPDMDYQLAIGVSKKADPQLFSIMNKAIQAMGTDKVDEILRHVSLEDEQPSLRDALYANRQLAAVVFGLLGILLTLSVGGWFYLRQMKLKNQQLMTATKARDLFFANVSHDMRSPLNGILGYAELGLQAASREESQACLTKVQGAGRLLLALVNDTLDLSKLQSRKMEIHPKPMLNRQLVETVRDIIAPQAARKKQEFTVLREPVYEGYVLADSLRLQQIFINLLNNAVKFTPQGGQVRFICQETAVGAAVNYKVLVCDNGIGMTRDYLPRLFEAYSQENRNSASQGAGTGLGMAIVKQLVEALQGKIEVESAPGRGTTFTVTFSLSQVPGYVPPDSREEEKQTRKVLAGKRVLLCEDQLINAELVTAVLKEWDLGVTWVKNGQEALACFQASTPGTYDLILMDKQMPVLGGVAAVKLLRKLARPDAVLPVAAMTGDVDEVSRQECLAAGMNIVLTKPLDRQQLRQALVSLLKEKL